MSACHRLFQSSWTSSFARPAARGATTLSWNVRAAIHFKWDRHISPFLDLPLLCCWLDLSVVRNKWQLITNISIWSSVSLVSLAVSGLCRCWTRCNNDHMSFVNYLHIWRVARSFCCIINNLFSSTLGERKKSRNCGRLTRRDLFNTHLLLVLFYFFFSHTDLFQWVIYDRKSIPFHHQSIDGTSPLAKKWFNRAQRGRKILLVPHCHHLFLVVMCHCFNRIHYLSLIAKSSPVILTWQIPHIKWDL